MVSWRLPLCVALCLFWSSAFFAFAAHCLENKGDDVQGVKRAFSICESLLFIGLLPVGCWLIVASFDW